jgi:hypothetical protein
MTLTEQDVLTLGEYCEGLLKEDHFNTLVRHYEHLAFQNFKSSALTDTVGRERIYAELNGVHDFCFMMTDFVARRDEQLAPSSDEDDVLTFD